MHTSNELLDQHCPTELTQATNLSSSHITEIKEIGYFNFTISAVYKNIIIWTCNRYKIIIDIFSGFLYQVSKIYTAYLSLDEPHSCGQ